MGKRSAPDKAMVLVRPSYKANYKRRAFVPGKSRTGGYYGRYAGRNTELKFFDGTTSDAVIASGGVITDSVNLIAQEVTENTRVGRKCVIKSINWKYELSLPTKDAQATPSASEEVRVILYLDKQCNGATATAAGILETTTIHGFRNLANSGRFNILMDKLHQLNYMTLASDGAGVVSQVNNTRQFSFYKSCNIPIEYDNTTGAITEIRSNNIGILLVSVQGTAAMVGNMRLRFSDGS